MLMTFVALSLLVALLVGSVLGSAALFWVGARWAKIPDVSFKRALVATLLVTAIGVFVQVVPVTVDAEERFPLAWAALSLAAVFCAWKVIQRVFRTNFWRAVLAWLVTLLALPAIYLLAWFVIHPFVCEWYVVPSNAMAPTIAGEHFTGRCPRCGGTLIIPASAQSSPLGDAIAICEACLQVSNVGAPEGDPSGGDRIIAFKALTPRRWDLVVFQSPSEPETVYVMRLVGLPGEEVTIRNGEAWIDGRVAPKPKDLAALRYSGWPDDALGKNEGEQEEAWGPAKLGDGEYFVLGDFSRRSADSRYWRVGAPGHPPYAVPEANMVGVVTHIYWPPSRWRSFR